MVPYLLFYERKNNVIDLPEPLILNSSKQKLSDSPEGHVHKKSNHSDELQGSDDVEDTDEIETIDSTNGNNQTVERPGFSQKRRPAGVRKVGITWKVYDLLLKG